MNNEWYLDLEWFDFYWFEFAHFGDRISGRRILHGEWENFEN